MAKTCVQKFFVRLQWNAQAIETHSPDVTPMQHSQPGTLRAPGCSRPFPTPEPAGVQQLTWWCGLASIGERASRAGIHQYTRAPAPTVEQVPVRGTVAILVPSSLAPRTTGSETRGNALLKLLD